jgi:hypothetical protein
MVTLEQNRAAPEPARLNGAPLGQRSSGKTNTLEIVLSNI